MFLSYYLKQKPSINIQVKNHTCNMDKITLINIMRTFCKKKEILGIRNFSNSKCPEMKFKNRVLKERTCSKGASLLKWFYLVRYHNELFQMWAESIFYNFFSLQSVKSFQYKRLIQTACLIWNWAQKQSFYCYNQFFFGLKGIFILFYDFSPLNEISRKQVSFHIYHDSELKDCMHNVFYAYININDS